MKAVLQNSYSLKRHLLMVIGLCLTCYFCYHIVFGERSYTELKLLSYQVEEHQKNYDDLRSSRLRLENNVVRLRPSSLDLDLLEERARYVLGYMGHNDHVIMKALQDIEGSSS